MSDLAAFALRYRTLVVFVVMLTVSWGVISFLTMPRREDPQFTIRTCSVTTSWPNTPATKIEELVTDPLEEILDGIEEVDVIRSTTRTGLSTVYVDVEDSVPAADIDNVWDKVRARVAKVRMPDPDIRPVVNDEFGDTHIILFAVYQNPPPKDEALRYTPRELDVFSDRVKDALRTIDGVAKAERFGVREEVINIETDAGNWSQLNLTVSELQDLVAARNIVTTGGSVDTPDGRFTLKPGGELNAVDEIKSVSVAQVGEGGTGNTVSLRELGLTVSRGYRDPAQLLARYGDAESSRPCVLVGLTMKGGGNIIDIAEAAKERVRELTEVEKVLPADIAVVPVSDQSENVSARVESVIENVVQAVLIVVAVVFLVVGFRAAAVMAANIPFVVLASIGLIPFFGVELEQISLASIIIALGLLVDNAVQVCDQSRTNQMAGMSPEDASREGAKTLASPMLSGTLTTVAAFFPMLIALDGSTYEYIYSLPVTLSVILGVSWLLAMTFCVILASSFIRAPGDPNKPGGPLPWLVAKLGGPSPGGGDFISGAYRRLASLALRSRFLVIALSAAVMVGGFMLPVSSEFFPQDERDQFVLNVYLPETATIEQTDAAVKQVEAILRALSPAAGEDGEPVQRIRTTRTLVGGGGSRWYLSLSPEPRKANYAEILVRTTDGKYTPELARRVAEVAMNGDEELGLEPVAGARVVPTELKLGPPANPIELRVSGYGFADDATLRGAADRVKDMIRAVPGTWDVSDSWGVKGYQLRIDTDPDGANLSGATNLDVARTLNAYFSGQYLTTFREGDHEVPVYFRLKPEERASLDVLRNAFVEGQNGRVPLNAIAEVKRRWEPTVIERRDLDRTIEVTAQVKAGASGNDVVLRVMASEEMQEFQSELPPGYKIEVGGSLEESRESTQEFGASLGISLVTIVLLLVIQYNSLAKSLIILATLPMALAGALFGLWVTDNPLGFMPQLGILSLFGIVLNTAIIYIEFADLLILKKAEESGGGPVCGLTREEFCDCLVEAGKQRLLPIFLTTATTVGGLLPLALAGGPLWVGLAWCMIFGLMTATVLTLVLVPVLYAVMTLTFGVKPVQVPDKPAGPPMAIPVEEEQ